MKKIKRTITIKKVEFIGNQNHDHLLNVDVCPLCHSPIHALPPAKKSAVEISAADIPLQFSEGQKVYEVKGDDNE